MIKDVYSNYLILHNIIILWLFLCVYICCVYCCERVFICWCFGVRSVLRVCVLVCEVSLLVFACVYVCVCSCLYIVIIRVLYVQCVCFRLCQYWYICVFCNLVHVSVCRCVSGRCVCGRLRVFERFIFITSALRTQYASILFLIHPIVKQYTLTKHEQHNKCVKNV